MTIIIRSFDSKRIISAIKFLRGVTKLRDGEPGCSLKAAKLAADNCQSFGHPIYIENVAPGARQIILDAATQNGVTIETSRGAVSVL